MFVFQISNCVACCLEQLESVLEIEIAYFLLHSHMSNDKGLSIESKCHMVNFTDFKVKSSRITRFLDLFVYFPFSSTH